MINAVPKKPIIFLNWTKNGEAKLLIHWKKMP